MHQDLEQVRNDARQERDPAKRAALLADEARLTADANLERIIAERERIETAPQKPVEGKDDHKKRESHGHHEKSSVERPGGEHEPSWYADGQREAQAAGLRDHHDAVENQIGMESAIHASGLGVRARGPQEDFALHAYGSNARTVAEAERHTKWIDATPTFREVYRTTMQLRAQGQHPHPNAVADALRTDYAAQLGGTFEKTERETGAPSYKQVADLRKMHVEHARAGGAKAWEAVEIDEVLHEQGVSNATPGRFDAYVERWKKDVGYQEPARIVNDRDPHRTPQPDDALAEKYGLTVAIDADEQTISYAHKQRGVQMTDRGDFITLHDERSAAAAVELAAKNFAQDGISLGSHLAPEKRDAILNAAVVQGVRVINPELAERYEQIVGERKNSQQKAQTQSASPTLEPEHGRDASEVNEQIAKDGPARPAPSPQPYQGESLAALQFVRPESLGTSNVPAVRGEHAEIERASFHGPRVVGKAEVSDVKEPSVADRLRNCVAEMQSRSAEHAEKLEQGIAQGITRAMHL